MTEAILWDNDGVLVDTETLYFEATRDVLAAVAIPLTEAQYKDLFLLQGRGAWHLAEERGFSPAEVERLRATRNDLYSQWLTQSNRAMADIAMVLGALHGRYRMGVVTSSRKDHFDLIHEKTGLLRFFDFILTASDVARVKPHPELYVRGVEKSGVAREACVAIEDSARGLEAARGAGVRCIVVPTSLTRDSPFAGAERVLDRLTDLLDVL